MNTCVTVTIVSAGVKRVNWKFGEIYKTVSYTNININTLFDHHRLTCMQTNTHFKNDIFGFFGGNL